jgi:hypothetical protein
MRLCADVFGGPKVLYWASFPVEAIQALAEVRVPMEVRCAPDSGAIADLTRGPS